jgi:hypothetical protein
MKTGGDIMKFLYFILIMLFMVTCSKGEKKNTKPVHKAETTPKLPKTVKLKIVPWFKPVPKEVQTKLENLVNALKRVKGAVNVVSILKKYLPKSDIDMHFITDKIEYQTVKVIEIKDSIPRGTHRGIHRGILRGILRGAMVFLTSTGKNKELDHFTIIIESSQNKPPYMILYPSTKIFSYPVKLVLSPYFKETGAFIFSYQKNKKKFFYLKIIGKGDMKEKLIFTQIHDKDGRGYYLKNKVDFFWVRDNSINAFYVVAVSKSINHYFVISSGITGSRYSCHRAHSITKISLMDEKLKTLTFTETTNLLKNDPIFKHIPKKFKATDSKKCLEFYGQ